MYSRPAISPHPHIGLAYTQPGEIISSGTFPYPSNGDVVTGASYPVQIVNIPPTAYTQLPSASTVHLVQPLTLQSSGMPFIHKEVIPLRKGKWTPEEEEYTGKIIHFFNTGALALPEGTTLRAYLAEKLHCDPMRITKKFTGSSCLGKRVYHSSD